MKLIGSILCTSFIFCKLCSVVSFLQPLQHKIVNSKSSTLSRISTRNNADNNDKTEKGETPAFDEEVRSKLFFENPVEPAAPVNIPLVDQSGEERRNAIQSQIAQRVAVLKKEGQWSDGPDVFGKDPLASQPIWLTMAAQLKECRFETLGEFATIYFLLLATTAFLTTYLLVLRDVFDGFIVWFIKNDFENEFLQSLFNQS